MIVSRNAPGVRLTLLRDEKAAGGEPLELGGRVISFKFEDSESKTDKLTLELDNSDLALFERQELLGGAIIEVAWGYPGNMSPPRRAVVKSLKGFQMLQLEAHAVSVLMNQVVKTRRWERVTRAEVARQVAREHGYEGGFVDIEDTREVIEVVNQTAETDARLLRRLAAREGFEFFVDGTGLHWHRRRQDAPPARVFTWYTDWRGEVLSVNVESDLVRRVGSVTARGRDPMGKATIEARANAERTSRSTLGDVLEVVDPKTGATTTVLRRNATATVVPTSAPTAALAEREATARFVQAERATLKLTLQVVGDPQLRAKSVIELRGVSSLLSGKYYVTDVQHALSGAGYICELRCVRDGRSGALAARGKPQTGDKNTHQTPAPGELRVIELVDGRTGETRLQYRAEGTSSGDPEAQTKGVR